MNKNLIKIGFFNILASNMFFSTQVYSGDVYDVSILYEQQDRNSNFKNAQDQFSAYYNFSKAAQLWRDLAQEGHAGAQYDLGFCYEFGIGIQEDKNAAYALYQMAAGQGHSAAKGALIFRKMRTEDKDDKEMRTEDKDDDPMVVFTKDSSSPTCFPKKLDNATLVEKIDWWHSIECSKKYSLSNLLKDHLMTAKLIDQQTENTQDNYADFFKNQSSMNAWVSDLLAQDHEKGMSFDSYEKLKQEYGLISQYSPDQNARADQGHAGAQYVKGFCFNDGQTRAYCRLAAHQGHAGAQYQMGQAYEKGKNVNQAIQCYQSAAHQGHAGAQYQMGLAYENGTGVEKNLDKAIHYYELAEKQKNSEAICRLYRNAYWSKVTEGGKITAGADQNLLLRIADHYAECMDVKNISQMVCSIYSRKAFMLYHLLADQDHAEACYKLGAMYEHGKNVSANMTEAVRYYQLSADKGHAEACYKLGAMYEHGKNVSANMTKAMHYYKLAADKGHAKGQYRYAVFLETKDKDVEGATELYQSVKTYYENRIDTEDPDDQYIIADCYCHGRGFDKNIQKAIELYTKADEKGHIDATYALGLCAKQKCLTGVDLQKAQERYFKKAAEKGHVSACYELAYFYEEGNEEYFEWVTLAAERGHVLAQLELAEKFALENRLQDAWVWFTKSAQQGNEQAQKGIERVSECMLYGYTYR